MLIVSGKILEQVEDDFAIRQAFGSYKIVGVKLEKHKGVKTSTSAAIVEFDTITSAQKAYARRHLITILGSPDVQINYYFKP